MKKLIFVVAALLFTAISIQDAGAYVFRKTWCHYGLGFYEYIYLDKDLGDLNITYSPWDRDYNVYVRAEVYPTQGSSACWTGIRQNGVWLIEVTADNYPSTYPPENDDDVDFQVSPDDMFHYWFQYQGRDRYGSQSGELVINSLSY